MRFTCHEQVCLIRLRFERCFRRESTLRYFRRENTWRENKFLLLNTKFGYCNIFLVKEANVNSR